MARLSKSVVLPPAVGVYARLFTPGDPPPGSNDKTPRYSIVLLYDKKDVKLLAPLMNAAVEVAEAKWPGKGAEKVRKMRYPIVRDGEESYPDDPSFKGKVFVRASTKADPTRRPPGVVNRKRERLHDDEEAYSGCTFKVEVRLYPFDKAGNAGIGIGLNNVQVIKTGERLDGRKNAEDVFEEEPDSDADISSLV